VFLFSNPLQPVESHAVLDFGADFRFAFIGSSVTFLGVSISLQERIT
jgi:hypothetical protein